MGYPDFPIPEQNKSYLTQAEILEFLNLYADHFKIRELIKVLVQKFWKQSEIISNNLVAV
jgi:cation diffusion facilitator CzcD-associated flavoprotein CzcO